MPTDLRRRTLGRCPAHPSRGLSAAARCHSALTDFDALPHRERNLVRFMFCDETARSLCTHWETAPAS
ncbi:MmyB family transcriptional regulator [Streptomyces noursei]|uniref:MmyB family transcriptional regulator n=1 Tax=Streptomyces noursei TaxID=1971 RepID=UPI00381A0C42